MSDKLKILFVSSEVAPFAKTGGLADVAGSLPPALKEQGLDVRVVMPRYKIVEEPMLTRLDFPITISGRKETAVIKEHRDGLVSGGHRVPVYFVDNYHYFDRKGLYGYPDEAARFAFFCRAVLEMLPGLDFNPDIIHCHDWQTGPIPVLIKEKYTNDPFYQNTATVFTIHNLQYQGNFPPDCLDFLGLPKELYSPEKLEFYGDVSFLKAGLIYSDLINTVSKSYAKEITTPAYGEGMEGILRMRSDDLFGILNGIDYTQFNPSNDPLIESHYTSQDISHKTDNKYALQQAMNLPVKDVPLLGVVSRLASQKGLDLLAQILDKVLAQNTQVVLLGTGENYYENLFKEAAAKYPDKFAAYIGFNAGLAQKIYAGCDMFLMPSKFEPCGLGQLISLRYGTIPIVRSTGGLADTITNYNPETMQGNGFVFEEPEADQFWQAANRAIQVYQQPEKWAGLVKNSMNCDFSWARSALDYTDLYNSAIKKQQQKI
ncbi:MAG TPA: glycogen synthase GlgA [Desulfobacteria bacterium]|nr:glycogen synthase GlgA [Desulfobacteria bacterium]